MPRDPARQAVLLARPDLGPAPRLGYVDSVFERAADRRTDPSFLDTKERAADAGAYLC